jgi:hypothetical protein
MSKICRDCSCDISVYSTRCTDCQAIRVKEKDIARKRALRQNGEAYAKVKIAQSKQREIKRDWVCEYLNANPCIDCGEDDIVVLEFDHRDSKTKITEVPKMMNSTYSLDKLKEEIDKCDIRCANCHNRKTIERLGGSYRTRWKTNN